MRKFRLILLFSIIAFVLLVVGAGSAAAIFYRDPTSPGSSKVSKQPSSPETSDMNAQQIQYYMEQNGIDYYYVGLGDPQDEYISYSGSGGYYTRGGEGDDYYEGAYDNAEMSGWITYYLHSSTSEKDDSYGSYYYYD